MAKLSTGSTVIEREDGSTVDLPIAIDKKRRIDTSYEIYFALHQAITGPEDRPKIFREPSHCPPAAFLPRRRLPGMLSARTDLARRSCRIRCRTVDPRRATHTYSRESHVESYARRLVRNAPDQPER